MPRNKHAHELDKEIAALEEERDTLDMRIGRAMSNEDRGNVFIPELDMETRSAVEIGRDAHAQAEIVIAETRDADGVMRTLGRGTLHFEGLGDPNKNATTVTGRTNNLQPEQQDLLSRPMNIETLRDIRYAMDRGLAGEMGLLGMDLNEVEARLMASIGDQLDGRGVADGIFNAMTAGPARGMAAASALGLAQPANTFTPRPKRLPGRVVKVAPGLWMRSNKPKKFKGSKAAKKASRQRR